MKKISVSIYASQVESNEQILIKAASSFTDRKGAEKICKKKSLTGISDRTHQRLTDIWEKHLAAIQVESPDKEAKQKFYGAFYRASFLPHAFNDVDGRYPAFAQKDSILQLAHDEVYYEELQYVGYLQSITSAHQLAVSHKSRPYDAVTVHKFEQGGWLPHLPLLNSYTAAMIGDHCIAAIGDACIKRHP